MKWQLIILSIILVGVPHHEAFPKGKEIFVTDGPVTSVSLKDRCFTIHEIMHLRFNKETILYNEAGKKIPIKELQKDEIVTVIFEEVGEELFAKEIYIHPDDGIVRFSRKGLSYLRKAGIPVEAKRDLLLHVAPLFKDTFGEEGPPSIPH